MILPGPKRFDAKNRQRLIPVFVFGLLRCGHVHNGLCVLRWVIAGIRRINRYRGDLSALPFIMPFGKSGHLRFRLTHRKYTPFQVLFSMTALPGHSLLLLPGM